MNERIKNWLVGVFGEILFVGDFNKGFLFPYNSVTTADAGMFYAPYIPLIVTSASTTTEIVPPVVFNTRYGINTLPAMKIYYDPNTKDSKE